MNHGRWAGIHRQYLIRRIAWRLQANAEGGLSERATRRAEELADNADVRLTPTRIMPGAAQASEFGVQYSERAEGRVNTLRTLARHLIRFAVVVLPYLRAPLEDYLPQTIRL